MTTYLIQRDEHGRARPLSELMQGIAPMPVTAESKHYEPKRNGAYGPVRSELRRQLEAMAVGDEIDTVERTAQQVSAIAYHVRRAVPEARFRAVSMGTFTRVRRIA
jgi:hypothetical protein